VGGDRVAFSLDLRGGEPLARVDDAAGESPPALAAQAADAGAGTIVVIDLARVGSDTGPDLGTIGDIRAAVPHMVLLAGGGVRGLDDLAQLADVGCDGALLATAVHSGRLAAADLAAARHFRARR
jgi:phosphoribosylformimino-5-aminoimidazole carboxamide ribotide isomerase